MAVTGAEPVRVAPALGENSLLDDRPHIIAFRTPASVPCIQGGERPRALAYALPFEGAYIVVFYDRVDTSQGIAPAISLRVDSRNRASVAGRQPTLLDRDHEALLGRHGLPEDEPRAAPVYARGCRVD